MSAGERWRPRVVRTSGSVVEAIYGLILATSVIAVSREYDSSNAGRIGITVLVTGSSSGWRTFTPACWRARSRSSAGSPI